MLDLAVLARRLRARGRIMWISRPQPQINELLELTGLLRLPGIKLVRSPVLT